MLQKRQVPVKIPDLIEAFEIGGNLITYYLDLETGDVLSVSDEIRSLLESLDAELYDEEGEPLMPFETLLEHHSEIPEWQKECLIEADRVESGYGVSVMAIEPEPHSDYNDMERFIAVVEDDQVANLLSYAIQGRGAFRRFKDVLLDYPQVREAWFAFKAESVEAHVRDWLDMYNIEVVS